MSVQVKETISRYFTKDFVETISANAGISYDKALASIHFSILAAVHQINFRLNNASGALVAYRMAKVAGAAEISKHLLSYYNKNSHYQGIINMASVLYNGDLTKIEKMLEDRFGLSEEMSNRILIVGTCATLAMLGERIKAKKIKPEGFREMVQLKLPAYTEALSSGLNFPFIHWESKEAALKNQLLRSAARRKRTSEKKSRFSLSFKWLFIAVVSVGILSYLFIAS
jgi:hypothetical protein